MEEKEDLYRRIKFETIKALAFNIFLNAAIAFLALNFVLSFFGIPYVVSLIPSVFYFIKSLFSNIRKFDLKDFEKNNPDLKHILDVAERSAKNISETRFANLIRRTKTAVFFNLISSKRVREKIYIIVFLALVSILIGSLHLYPTKVFFRMSDIDLTQPGLWTNLYERIEIERPEFSSCYSELNYTKDVFGKTSAELIITKNRLDETTEELNESKNTAINLHNELTECTKDLNDATPFIGKYDNCKNNLDSTDARLTSCLASAQTLESQKASCAAEKTIYIEENADLRKRNDDLRDDLSDCKDDLASC